MESEGGLYQGVQRDLSPLCSWLEDASQCGGVEHICNKQHRLSLSGCLQHWVSVLRDGCPAPVCAQSRTHCFPRAHAIVHYPVAAQSARSRLVHRQAHTLTLTQSVTRARSLSLSLLSCADSLSRQSLTNSVAVSVCDSAQSPRIDSAQSVCAVCDSALCATARVLSLSLLS